LLFAKLLPAEAIPRESPCESPLLIQRLTDVDVDIGKQFVRCHAAGIDAQGIANELSLFPLVLPFEVKGIIDERMQVEHLGLVTVLEWPAFIGQLSICTRADE
jgi:hypothetical protein